MDNTSILLAEKRTLIEIVQNQEATIIELNGRLKDIHEFIHQLTTDSYIESDYVLEQVKKMIYDRRPAAQTTSSPRT